MATNRYISQKHREEQNLYEDLIIEAIQFYGQDVYYLPREIVEKEEIFLDAIESQFSDAYKIEVFIENSEAFDGEGDIFTKFGIELRDQATFVIARRRWKHLIGDRLSKAEFRPREGDVIYLPLSQSLFQVMKVETETPFYQLSQLPLFRVQCELFDFSDEDFDTGIPEIDSIEAEGAFQYEFTMPSEDLGRDIYYGIGETVQQAFDNYVIEGEVTSWNHDTRMLKVAHTRASDGQWHDWSTTKEITGEHASLIPVTEEENITKIQPDAQNKMFNDFANDFVDFTESNPFGDILE